MAKMAPPAFQFPNSRGSPIYIIFHNRWSFFCVGDCIFLAHMSADQPYMTRAFALSANVARQSPPVCYFRLSGTPVISREDFSSPRSDHVAAWSLWSSLAPWPPFRSSLTDEISVSWFRHLGQAPPGPPFALRKHQSPSTTRCQAGRHEGGAPFGNDPPEIALVGSEVLFLFAFRPTCP